MIGTTAAIIGSAVVGAGASMLSSKAQSKAASKASASADRATEAQVLANRENIDFQKEVFQQQRDDAAPWREVGTRALASLEKGIADGSFSMDNFDFKTDPGYEFRMAEGQKALERSQAARGNLLSGGAGKAATRYAQGVASDEYSRAYARAAGEKQTNFNMLANLSGVGQTANNSIAGARSTMASAVGSSTAAAGNAIAQGANAQGQIALQNGQNQASMYGNVAGSINTGLQNYLTYDMLGR